MKHYIVAIGIAGGKGYRRVLSRHTTQQDALADILNRRPLAYSVVYRDGISGKRYSWSECVQLRKGI